VLNADKTGQVSKWMSQNRCLRCHAAFQLRLEFLDGRGHDDVSWQLVSNLDSCREEAVVEIVDLIIII